jgi:hypothetical protein
MIISSESAFLTWGNYNTKNDPEYLVRSESFDTITGKGYILLLVITLAFRGFNA